MVSRVSGDRWPGSFCSLSERLGIPHETIHPDDHAAADRIGAAADRDPQGPTAQSGFDDRAEAAADRNDPSYDDYDDYDDME